MSAFEELRRCLRDMFRRGCADARRMEPSVMQRTGQRSCVFLGLRTHGPCRPHPVHRDHPPRHRHVPRCLLSILVVCVGFAGWACGASGKRLAGSKTGADAVAVVDVIAPYNATLMNRLDEASIDPSVLPDPKPSWLEPYRRARQAWLSGPYFEHVDASFVPHLRCGYFDKSLDELLLCLRRVLPLAHHRIIEEAVRGMDHILKPGWPVMQQRVSYVQTKLQSALRDKRAAQVFDELRRFVQLPGGTPLDVRIVVVAAMQDSPRLGRREESMLIVEVERGHGWSRALATVFHELAHFAMAASPVLRDLEDEFARLGPYGTVAGNYWNEATATAFEQLGIAQFDDASSLGETLYGDVVVDALGRALFLDMQATRLQRLGRNFANRLTDLAKTYWPMSRWTLAHVFFRAAVMSNHLPALDAFRNGASLHAFWGLSPLPVPRDMPRSIPPSVPHLYLMTPDDLTKVPALRDQWNIDEIELRLRVLQGPALWAPSLAPGKVSVLVLFASSPDALRKAARQLASTLPRIRYPVKAWQSVQAAPSPWLP